MRYIVAGMIFIIAACCFAVGAINHILNTGESAMPAMLLALGCLCGAVFFLRKK